LATEGHGKHGKGKGKLARVGSTRRREGTKGVEGNDY